jgi:hypothetical protein
MNVEISRSTDRCYSSSRRRQLASGHALGRKKSRLPVRQSGSKILMPNPWVDQSHRVTIMQLSIQATNELE